MKRLLTIVALLVVTILFACSMEDTADAKNENYLPFDVYEYKDSDGCEYVAIYEFATGMSTIKKAIQSNPMCE